MSKNEPAFPRPVGEYHDNGCTYYNDSQSGMTLRDYFAAKALPALSSLYPVSSFETISSMAYKLADTMLEERTRKQPPPVTSTE